MVAEGEKRVDGLEIRVFSDIGGGCGREREVRKAGIPEGEQSGRHHG